MAAPESRIGGIIFPMWVGRHLVTLHDILIRLNPLLSTAEWRCRVQEVAGEDPERWYALDETDSMASSESLLNLANDGTQIIDGDFLAVRPSGEPMLLLRAVDSTHWDLFTTEQEILDEIRANFRDVQPWPPDFGKPYLPGWTD